MEIPITQPKVYATLKGILNDIDAINEKISKLATRRQDLRKKCQRILEYENNTTLSIWFAEECNK